MVLPASCGNRSCVGVVAVLAFVSWTAAVAAAGPRRTLSASSGETHATLTYFRYLDDYGRPHPQLRIIRGGAEFSTAIPPNPQDRFGAKGRVVVDDAAVSGRSAAPLVVRDLDRDGEPEVAVMLFWGGQRCCFWSRIYRFDRRAGRYRATNHFWGNNQDKPMLRQLSSDGSVEFVARDGRFQTLLPTYAYVDPVQVWSYRAGRFREVTGRFRSLIGRDARALWAQYVHAPRGIEARWYLAAWVADEYRLDRHGAADAVVQRALRSGRLDVSKIEHMASARKWVGILKAFLRRSGY
jgi:hypothetical protein